MLTSYEKFSFYHYKSIQNGDSNVLVVGVRGQGIFAEVKFFCFISICFLESSMVLTVKANTKM